MKSTKAAEGTYQIDVRAAVFGTCNRCGQPKTRQTGAALTCHATASVAATEDDAATACEKTAAAEADANVATIIKR